MTESRTRTIVKAVTYRATAWLLTVPWAYIFMGDVAEAAGSAAVLHLVLSADYYVHERVWLRFKWGTK